MDRTIIDLPCGMFGPIVSDWILNVRGRAANDGVTGAGQVIYGNQPRWEATLDLSGFGRDRVLVWRSIRARMRGRVNVLRVCICDRWKPKYSELGLSNYDISLLQNGIPHTVPGKGDVLFSSGVGYDYVPTYTMPIAVAAGSDHFHYNATSTNNALKPGQFFSVNDWPYQVVAPISGPAADRVIFFEPPLRRAIAIGDKMIIGEATGLFAFQDDMQGRMPLQLGKHGDTQIQLVEWINRP